MRSLFASSLSLAVAGLAVLAACSDRQQQPTAPSASALTQPNLATAISDGPIGNAKPVPGFTNVVTVDGEWAYITPGKAGAATVACPVGTRLVGGGYHIGDETFEAPLHVRTNKPLGDTWHVDAYNPVASAVTAKVFALARCAS